MCDFNLLDIIIYANGYIDWNDWQYANEVANSCALNSFCPDVQNPALCGYVKQYQETLCSLYQEYQE